MNHRFVWMAREMSLSRRVRHLEERWAYYLAFGPSLHLLSHLLANKHVLVNQVFRRQHFVPVVMVLPMVQYLR